MRIIECEQRSDEWWNAKLGIPTASCFHRIVTTKGDRSKQRDGYLYSLVAERLVGKQDESYMSPAMEEGILREEESRWVYAMTYEVVVDEVGFCLADNGRWGCSPDGLVGDDGLIELKNPKAKTAVEYLVGGNLPSTYYQQVMGGLFVTGRDWADFISYCEGLPLLVVRVKPDKEFFEKLEEELTLFCDDLDRVYNELSTR